MAEITVADRQVDVGLGACILITQAGRWGREGEKEREGGRMKEREREREKLNLAWTSETSKPTLYDTPPTRPHLLVFPKEFQ